LRNYKPISKPNDIQRKNSDILAIFIRLKQKKRRNNLDCSAFGGR